MLDSKFYWGTTRKAIVAFGNMFNDITIDRMDASNNIAQTIKVPLSYAPKQKFLARIAQLPEGDQKNMQVILPRMSFEMLGLKYDFNRKVSPIQQNRSMESGSVSINSQYAPTPYNIDVSLYLYAKNQDDGLQVIEQILPYFNPDYNLTLKAIPVLNLKNDLPIVLNSVTFEDSYEDSMNTRRSIVWTLDFTMKLNYYGPVNKQGIIRKVTASTYSDVALETLNKTYTVQVDPLAANLTSATGYVESFKEF